MTLVTERHQPTITESVSKPSLCNDSISEDLELEFSQKRKPEKLHKCTFKGCDACFVRPCRLKVHLNSHLGKKPFKCGYKGCQKSYTSNSHLRRHNITAHAKKEDYVTYKCRVADCMVEFKTLYSEKRHYRRTHIKKRCPKCSQVFLNQKQFKRHFIIHSSTLSPFVCAVCKIRFSRKSNLSRHQRTHQIYLCPVKGCFLAFDVFSLLRKHIATHPCDYYCFYCNKGYRKKKFMKTHVLKHIVGENYLQKLPREKPYKLKHFTCDVCSKEILGKASLNRHKRLMHELRLPKNIQESSPKPRAIRKDKGILRGPIKSFAAKLSQIEIPKDFEEELLKPISEEEFLKEFLLPNDF